MKKQSLYISEISHLLSEWNWEKNALLDPQRVPSKSNKKVWWKCNVCQREWEATPNSRSRGCRCPECGKKLAIKNKEIKKLQKGPLVQTYPYLLKEWDFEQNDIDPNSITSHYSKKVHWICAKSHQWNRCIHKEIDIFIPIPNAGIEYDELYYYKSEKVLADEYSEYCSKGGIDIYEVTEYAATKWNFANVEQDWLAVSVSALIHIIYLKELANWNPPPH